MSHRDDAGCTMTDPIRHVSAKEGDRAGWSPVYSASHIHWLVTFVSLLSLTGSHLRAQEIWVGGGPDGHLVHTVDGGANWTSVNFDAPLSSIGAIDFLDANTGWIGGSSFGLHRVLHTSDGGANWVPQLRTTENVEDLYFLDENNGWAGASFALGLSIYHTDDGGSNWVDQIPIPQNDFPVVPFSLRALTFVDANNGWVASSQGHIANTSDGGSNWTLQYDGSGTDNFIDLSFVDENTGWAVGATGRILHTNDGGTEWSLQESNTTRHLRGTYFFDRDHGWAVGDLGTIIHTADGGITWSTQESGTEVQLLGVAFADVNTGWAVGDRGTILHTGNGGASWTAQPIDADTYFRAIDIVMDAVTPSDVVWVGTSGDWLDMTNWNTGMVPDETRNERAQIDNAGSAQINDVAPALLGVNISDGSVTISQNGSVEILGDIEVGQDGSLSLSGENARLSAVNLSVSGAVTVADGGLGTVANAYAQSRGTTSLDGGNLQVGSLELLGGSLVGAGSVLGDVTNAARISPGFSPEIITIDGDYTQDAAGVLEIEIGGLTPGAMGHDQLVVTGSATLAGRLDLSLIDEFAPAANDAIEMLTASNVTGEFDSIFFANPPTDLAVSVNYNAMNVEVRFEDASSLAYFPAPAGTSNWSDPATWEGGVPPDTRNELVLESGADGPQQLSVNTNAFAHQATIAGPTQPMTVQIESGIRLSVTHGVTVDEGGTVLLDDGTLLSSTIEIASGGTLGGNGQVVGDVINSGELQPGQSPGELSIEGNFTQTETGLLRIELGGTTASDEFDVLLIDGMATLGGTLDVSLIDTGNGEFNPMPGDEFEIVRADGGIQGAFTNVNFPLLSNFLYFDLEYSDAGPTIGIGLFSADFDDDGDIDNEDFDIWQMGLMIENPMQGDGDADLDGDVDGDDYLILQEQFGMTTAQILANVPEPSANFIWAGILIVLLSMRRSMRTTLEI